MEISSTIQPPQTANIRGNLLSIVDSLVEAGFLGFESREDFVTSAVRKQIQEYFCVFPEARSVYRDWLVSQKTKQGEIEK